MVAVLLFTAALVRSWLERELRRLVPLRGTTRH